MSPFHERHWDGSPPCSQLDLFLSYSFAIPVGAIQGFLPVPLQRVCPRTNLFHSHRRPNGNMLKHINVKQSVLMEGKLRVGIFKEGWWGFSDNWGMTLGIVRFVKKKDKVDVIKPTTCTLPPGVWTKQGEKQSRRLGCGWHCVWRSSRQRARSFPSLLFGIEGAAKQEIISEGKHTAVNMRDSTRRTVKYTSTRWGWITHLLFHHSNLWHCFVLHTRPEHLLSNGWKTQKMRWEITEVWLG